MSYVYMMTKGMSGLGLGQTRTTVEPVSTVPTTSGTATTLIGKVAGAVSVPAHTIMIEEMEYQPAGMVKLTGKTAEALNLPVPTVPIQSVQYGAGAGTSAGAGTTTSGTRLTLQGHGYSLCGLGGGFEVKVKTGSVATLASLAVQLIKESPQQCLDLLTDLISFDKSKFKDVLNKALGNMGFPSSVVTTAKAILLYDPQKAYDMIKEAIGTMGVTPKVEEQPKTANGESVWSTMTKKAAEAAKQAAAVAAKQAAEAKAKYGALSPAVQSAIQYATQKQAEAEVAEAAVAKPSYVLPLVVGGLVISALGLFFLKRRK